MQILLRLRTDCVGTGQGVWTALCAFPVKAKVTILARITYVYMLCYMEPTLIMELHLF